MDGKSLIRMEMDKMLLYQTLARFYEFQNPALHECYYRKYFVCVQNLAHLVQTAGDPFEVTAVSHVMPGWPGPEIEFPYRTQGENEQLEAEPGRSPGVKLRVLHASFEGPAVDVYANGRLVVEDLTYKKITSYAELPSSPVKLELFRKGEREHPFLAETIQTEPGMSYTVAAVGSPGALGFVTLQDDMEAPEDKAKIRFLHLSPDAPAVDIAIRAGSMLFTHLAYKGNSGYVTTAPMTGDLEIRTAGSDKPVLILPKVELKSGRLYTIVAVGQLNGTPEFELLLVTD